jgi:hypothetical protein
MAPGQVLNPALNGKSRTAWSADIDKQIKGNRRRDEAIEGIEQKLKIGYVREVLFEVEMRVK